ncbi:MAG TPA: DUF5781 family protein [Thermoplasmata archaeon]|nr:DUF5781 family protein [Thermoplasmata archaeon]
MLVTVLDRTDCADVDDVRATFQSVERRLAAHGLRVAWPVEVEVVRMPIMGATKSTKGHHTLYASLDAVRSNAFDGLLAHEMGHMIRTETRHPSHDPALYQSLGKAVRVPRDGLQALGEAFNHVQDVYADDLSFLSGFDGRAHEFFRVWIEGNSRRANASRWENVRRCVTNGFALGNLLRHGLLPDDDPLWALARDFDRRARVDAVDGFAEFFASLPADPKPGALVERVKFLAGSLVQATNSRRL